MDQASRALRAAIRIRHRRHIVPLVGAPPTLRGKKARLGKWPARRPPPPPPYKTKKMGVGELLSRAFPIVIRPPTREFADKTPRVTCEVPAHLHARHRHDERMKPKGQSCCRKYPAFFSTLTGRYRTTARISAEMELLRTPPGVQPGRTAPDVRRLSEGPSPAPAPGRANLAQFYCGHTAGTHAGRAEKG